VFGTSRVNSSFPGGLLYFRGTGNHVGPVYQEKTGFARDVYIDISSITSYTSLLILCKEIRLCRKNRLHRNTSPALLHKPSALIQDGTLMKVATTMDITLVENTLSKLEIHFRYIYVLFLTFSSTL
jgi:hypothetical protein